MAKKAKPDTLAIGDPPYAKPALKLVLSSGGEQARTFPKAEIITNAISMSPDEVVEEGRKFAERMLERCSGHFIEGIRQILLEQPRYFYYRPDE